MFLHCTITRLRDAASLRKAPLQEGIGIERVVSSPEAFIFHARVLWWRCFTEQHAEAGNFTNLDIYDRVGWCTLLQSLREFQHSKMNDSMLFMAIQRTCRKAGRIITMMDTEFGKMIS